MGCQLPYTPVVWKKGDKPEEHCHKVEDWFAYFEIANGDKVVRFKGTLFRCRRTWIDTVHPDPGSWDTAGDPTRLKT